MSAGYRNGTFSALGQWLAFMNWNEHNEQLQIDRMPSKQLLHATTKGTDIIFFVD